MEVKYFTGPSRYVVFTEPQEPRPINNIFLTDPDFNLMETEQPYLYITKPKKYRPPCKLPRPNIIPKYLHAHTAGPGEKCDVCFLTEEAADPKHNYIDSKWDEMNFAIRNLTKLILKYYKEVKKDSVDANKVKKMIDSRKRKCKELSKRPVVLKYYHRPDGSKIGGHFEPEGIFGKSLKRPLNTLNVSATHNVFDTDAQPIPAKPSPSLEEMGSTVDPKATRKVPYADSNFPYTYTHLMKAKPVPNYISYTIPENMKDICGEDKSLKKMDFEEYKNSCKGKFFVKDTGNMICPDYFDEMCDAERYITIHKGSRAKQIRIGPDHLDKTKSHIFADYN